MVMLMFNFDSAGSSLRDLLIDWKAGAESSRTVAPVMLTVGATDEIRASLIDGMVWSFVRQQVT